MGGGKQDSNLRSQGKASVLPTSKSAPANGKSHDKHGDPCTIQTEKKGVYTHLDKYDTTGMC